MEPWLIMGALGYLAYAISSSIDKHFMNKRYDPISTNTFKMFFDGFILLIIGMLFFKLNFSRELFLWSLPLGGLYAATGILYFKSLNLKEVHVVIPYTQSSKILLVFISSVILFNEAVSTFNWIGLALILFGIYEVLTEDGFRIPRLEKGVFIMSLNIIVGTIYSLLTKKLLFDVKPIDLSIMMYFSTTIILGCYTAVSRKQKRLFSIKSSNIVVAAFFAAIGTLLVYYALSVGYASKVYSIIGLQSAFVYIIAISLLKEKFYWHKMIGVILILAGIFLISL